MNFIHNDARNCLRNKHMNAVLCTWSEKEKILAGDRLFLKMWEHFQQHRLSNIERRSITATYLASDIVR